MNDGKEPKKTLDDSIAFFNEYDQVCYYDIDTKHAHSRPVEEIVCKDESIDTLKK